MSEYVGIAACINVLIKLLSKLCSFIMYDITVCTSYSKLRFILFLLTNETKKLIILVITDLSVSYIITFKIL